MNNEMEKIYKEEEEMGRKLFIAKRASIIKHYKDLYEIDVTEYFNDPVFLGKLEKEIEIIHKKSNIDNITSLKGMIVDRQLSTIMENKMKEALMVSIQSNQELMEKYQVAQKRNQEYEKLLMRNKINTISVEQSVKDFTASLEVAIIPKNTNSLGDLMRSLNKQLAEIRKLK